jgi:hypothetical protein
MAEFILSAAAEGRSCALDEQGQRSILPIIPVKHAGNDTSLFNNIGLADAI